MFPVVSSSAINQPPQITANAGISLYKDVSVYRKKAHEYAEETRIMLLKGIVRKETTQPIQGRLAKSTFEVSTVLNSKSQVPLSNKISNPDRLPRIMKSDPKLAGTTQNIKKTLKLNNQSSDDSSIKAKMTQSLFELDKKHCDKVESILNGSDPDISLSMDRSRQPSNGKKISPKLQSSVILFTPFQENPVIVPNLDISSGRRISDASLRIKTPNIDEFDKDDFKFLRDLGKLYEYQDAHQKNILSSITRDLLTIHKENVGSLSDKELLQMIHSLIVHIDGKILVNAEITKELLCVFENGFGSCENRELALQLKASIQKLSKAEYIDFKVIIGHIRRIAIVYEYDKCVWGLTSLLSELIFDTGTTNESYVGTSPSRLHGDIFKKNGPQSQLSAIFELMLYYYNIF